MKQLLDRPGMVFLLVFLWKAVLLLTVAQPVPANDAFFCDGPVVHFLNHGGYFNPPVAQSRPFSGTEFFCAYPPLYQVVLLGWMSVFGTSALAAMWFHLVSFGGYAWVVLTIFRRLEVPDRAGNLAAFFLLAITFDDKSDGLASLLGMLGVLAMTRWLAGVRGAAVVAALCAVLTVCTSLQVGGLYSTWIFLGLLGGWMISKIRAPLGAVAVLVFAPPILAGSVKFGLPRIWAGFLENVRGNASLSGVHFPHVEDLLKAARNLPAMLLIGALLLLAPAGWRFLRGIKNWDRSEIVFAAGLIAGLGYTGACLFLVTANWLVSVIYVQPVLVGLFLLAAAKINPAMPRTRIFNIGFVALVALVSVRAIGLTSWGAACSVKNSYASTRERIAADLASAPPGANILLSSAYLYEADRHTNVISIHEDYASLREENENFPLALRRLKPPELLLTQYDFYRRYQTVLNELRAGGGVQIAVTNLAHVATPDSSPRLQRVLQHISWAPVIVSLKWE